MTERTLRAWRPSLATVQAEVDLLDHEALIIENSMHVTLGVSLSDFVHLRIEPSSKALWSSTKREISRRDHRRRLFFLSLSRAVRTVYQLMSPAKLSQRPNSHHHPPSSIPVYKRRARCSVSRFFRIFPSSQYFVLD
jgi:hypothetical protein